ncbi:hypothetical protein DsansV1_C14g0130351 [Dioscorea sansibarensis]
MGDGMDVEIGSTSASMEEEELVTGSSTAAHGDGWELLGLARQLASQGKPSLALQAVVLAIKSVGGEQAVLQMLGRARQLYQNKLRSNAAADELASLFAECLIAEVHPGKSNPSPSNMVSPSTLLSNSAESSILGTSGRKQIMLDAFSDGSSFICLRCGGLVSNLRKDEHLTYWCG